jgi:catechol 2,3-dioxygenase-like lactoylglutathione lyase family enzyme
VSELSSGSSAVPVGLRFELFVDDVERSLAFYGAALGLRPSPGYDPQGYVPVSAGPVRIGLQRRSALLPEHHFRPAHFAGPRGVGVEIVLEVDDVHVAFARARDAAMAHGGQIESLAARPWGQSDFRLIDPDGYYIRVTSIG